MQKRHERLSVVAHFIGEVHEKKGREEMNVRHKVWKIKKMKILRRKVPENELIIAALEITQCIVCVSVCVGVQDCVSVEHCTLTSAE